MTQTIDLANAERKAPLQKPWKKMTCIGRAYEILLADTQAHLAYLQQTIGYEYVRFHAIFHDELAVFALNETEQPVYNWHYIDRVYDTLLELGLRPFIELGPMPLALASGEQTIFWYRMNVTPPHDWQMWEDLIFAFVGHLAERYGINEVEQWYFEVWNEPDLPGFWTGTQADYFELYRRAARAIKAVNPQFQVGGPATSKTVWLADFLDFCHREDVAVDFVSTHLYPQDEYVLYPQREGSPHAPGQFFVDMVQQARKTVQQSSFPDLPLHWTEWNTQTVDETGTISWGQNKAVDSLYAAAAIVEYCTKLDNTIDSFAYWVASDIIEEFGIPQYPFSHRYGLLTIDGVPKASYNAFMLLNKMQGHRLVLDVNPPTHCGICATTTPNTLHVLLWYIKPFDVSLDNLQDWTVRLDGLSHDRVIEVRITNKAGNSYGAWQTLGSPATLSRSELTLLQAAAHPRQTCHRVEGNEFNLTVHPYEVVYLEFSAYPQSLPSIRNNNRLEKQLTS